MKEYRKKNMSALLKQLPGHELKATPTATIVPFKQKTVKQLAPEEARLVVDVAKDSITRFTQDHVKTLISLRSQEKYPRIYGSLSTLDWEETKLVNDEDIIEDNKTFIQLVRAGVNPKGKSISEDLYENGYSLGELPMMVLKFGDKYLPIDGRTRNTYLGGMGMKNRIVDVFVDPEEKTNGREASFAKVVIFATYLNNYKKEFGAASYHDIQKAIMTLIELKAIKMQEGEMGRIDMTEAISNALEQMSSKLTANQTNDLIHDGIEKLTGVRQVASFPNGKGVYEWLHENGYDDNAEIMYVPVSTSFIGKLHTTMVTKVRDNPSKSEFRMVGYVGVLNADNPKDHWKKNLSFKQDLIDFEKALSILRFGGAKRISPKIRLHGLIPQVKELEDKYPMDKLYVFPKDHAEG